MENQRRSGIIHQILPPRRFNPNIDGTCASDSFLQMCQTFIPLLSKTGRIVNVSSVGSSLKQYSKAIQQRFRSSKMTLEGLEGMMQEYQVLISRQA